MFDVNWADEECELVGEHRAKKKLAREKEETEKAEAARNSVSTHRSSVPEEKSFKIFGSGILKKALAPLKFKSSSNSSAVRAHAPIPQHTRLSSVQESRKQNSETFGSLSSFLRGGEKSPEWEHEYRPRNEQISYPSSRDSAISKWTDTAPTNLSPLATSFADSAKSSGVQPLGQSSFIAQSIAAVCPRTPDADILRSVSEISFSCGTRHGDLSQIQSPEAEELLDEPDLPINLYPGPKSPLRSLPPEWASSFTPNNLDAWKPPAAWNSESMMGAVSGNLSGLSKGDTRKDQAEKSRASEICEMRKELEMMAVADLATCLKRLCEPWDDTRDAGEYKEFEMEKKRWMLSALFNMDEAVKAAISTPLPPQNSGGPPRKVLALYESHATASYLATIHNKEQVYHVSSSPLSNEEFPNIHPVAILPTVARIFSAAYSLSLPSHAPGLDIPIVLKSVKRCLMHGASFYITLIDSMPVASSVGPHMRKWLDEHLIINLEKKVRCVNPVRAVPDYLAECCLRGEGSQISTARFLAIWPGDGGVPQTADGKPHPRALKAQLRGEVGRMLWTEVWGADVTGEGWWWEEPECVNECLQLGTFWEYCIIKAVREG